MENDLFYKYICDYILGNISTLQLIDVAVECITAGMRSDNLYILAGLSEYDDIIHFYKLTLFELKIQEPNKENAGKYLIQYYCNELIENRTSPKIFLQNIKNKIFDKTGKDNKVVGDYFKIEKIIALFYELCNIEELKLNNKYIEEECYKVAKEYIEINCKNNIVIK